MREKILEYLQERGREVVDVGNKELEPEDDFPGIARAAVMGLLSSDDGARAILICSGGQGMAMMANRFRGVRAVVAWDTTEVRVSRNDNDSNVLCLPARVLDGNETLWKDIIDTWLEAPFAAASRYIRRNGQLDEI